MNNSDFDIDVDKVVKHWLETSDDDFETLFPDTERRSIK